MNSRVVRSGVAPINGGAIRTATRPNPATSWAFARTAMTAAAIELARAPSSPTSTGIRS